MKRLWVNLPFIKKHYRNKVIDFVKSGDLSNVKKYVEMGVDPDTKCDRVFTLLSLAVLYGFDDIAKYLLTKDVNLNFYVLDNEEMNIDWILDTGLRQQRNDIEKYNNIRHDLEISRLKRNRKNKLKRICLE